MVLLLYLWLFDPLEFVCWWLAARSMLDKLCDHVSSCHRN